MALYQSGSGLGALVGVGTTNPTSNLQVYGTPIAAGNVFSVLNTAASGNVAQFSSSSGTALIINASGFVGIGKTNPGGALDISGNIVSSNIVAAYGSPASITQGSNVFVFSNAYGFANVMVMNSTGSIGIGTTNPSTIMHILGLAPQVRIQTSTAASDPTISLNDSSGNKKWLAGYSGTGTYWYMQNDSKDVFRVYSGTSADLFVQPSGGNMTVGQGLTAVASARPSTFVIGAQPSGPATGLSASTIYYASNFNIIAPSMTGVLATGVATASQQGGDLNLQVGSVYDTGNGANAGNIIGGNCNLYGGVAYCASTAGGSNTKPYSGHVIFYTGNNNGTTSTDYGSTLRMIILGGTGYVGIGTNSPGTKFDVYTTGHGIRQTDSGGGAIIEFYTNASYGWVGTFNNYPLAFFTNNAAAQMILSTAGNVGIGTTNPGYPLDVTGDMHCSGAIYCGNNSSATAAGSIGGRMYFGGTYGDQNYSDGGQILSRLYATTESSELVIFKGNDANASVSLADRIRLRAGAICFDTYTGASSDPAAESIRMVIDQSGNVGIGTTSPGASKTFIYSTASAATTNSILSIGDTIGYGNGSGDMTCESCLYSSLGSTNSIVNQIGKTNDTNSYFYGYNGAGYFWINKYGNSSSTGFVVKGNNVGIGTTNPGYLLDVAGSMRLNGDYTYIGGNGGSASTTWAFDHIDTGSTFKSILFGYANSGGNAAEIGFNYVSSGSGSNYVGIGFYGSRPLNVTYAGNVGIGLTNPSYTLDVSGKGRFYESTGTTAGNSGQGTLVIQHGNNGGSSSIVFPSAINYGGSDYGYIQYNDNRTAGGENATFIIGIQNDADDHIALLASGNIGIQRSDPSYALDVSGTIRATYDIIAYSDKRVKTDFEPIENALDKVSKITGYTFRRIDEVDKDKRHAGVIAQEVLEILPEVVHEEKNGHLSVAYGNLAALFIQAIKEERKAREAVTCELRSLEERIKLLEQK